MFGGENRFPRVHLGRCPYRLSSRSHQTRIQSRHAAGALAEDLLEETNNHITHFAVRGTVKEAREDPMGRVRLSAGQRSVTDGGEKRGQSSALKQHSLGL